MGGGGSGLANVSVIRTAVGQRFSPTSPAWKVASEQGYSLVNRDSTDVPVFILTLSAYSFKSEPVQSSQKITDWLVSFAQHCMRYSAVAESLFPKGNR